MKLYFNKHLNVNEKSITQFKVKAKSYIFELCFYIYLIAKYSFQKSVFIWNNTIDFLNLNLPITITDTFPLHSFKINHKDNDVFKYVCYNHVYEQDSNSSSYTTTYTNDTQQVMKNINLYDYIVVNHYGGLKNKELFKRVFTKDNIDTLQKNVKLLDDCEILKNNPFIYLSVNYNSKHIDFNLNKDEENDENKLNINETLDCYLKLKQYYVKGNRIDRDFLHFLFMNEYKIDLNHYPSYVIDVIDNDISEKRYFISDEFVYNL